jgi:hypothetical protein
MSVTKTLTVSKTWLSLGAILVLLVLGRGFSVETDVPLLFIIVAAGAVFYTMGLYALTWMKSYGPRVFMESGVRDSASTFIFLDASAEEERDATGLPPMAALPTGGTSAMYGAWPDLNVAFVPKDSVEFLNDRVALVYAKTQPIDTKLWEGIAGTYADISVKSPYPGYMRGKSTVNIGFLNRLHVGEATENNIRTQDLIISKFAGLIGDYRIKSRRWQDALITRMRAIARTRKQTPSEHVSRFFSAQRREIDMSEAQRKADRERQT